MAIQIKHRLTDAILCSFEVETLRDAVIEAVKNGTDLRGADLHGANLRYANLRGANLYGADLYHEKLAISPLFVNGLIWNITITESYLTIGCQHHEHSSWSKFTDIEIEQMESRALEFWKQNKSWLLSACKAHRKESLKKRKEMEKENANN